MCRAELAVIRIPHDDGTESAEVLLKVGRATRGMLDGVEPENVLLDARSDLLPSIIGYSMASATLKAIRSPAFETLPEPAQKNILNMAKIFRIKA